MKANASFQRSEASRAAALAAAARSASRDGEGGGAGTAGRTDGVEEATGWTVAAGAQAGSATPAPARQARRQEETLELRFMPRPRGYRIGTDPATPTRTRDPQVVGTRNGAVPYRYQTA